MIQWWQSLGLEWQLGFVVLLGILVGPLLNWSIYNFAYFPSPISPWNRKRFRDYTVKHPELVELLNNTSKLSVKHVPIFGWLFLRNEASVHGKLFWLRPMGIELLWPAFLAWLFWFETSGGLLPALALPPVAVIEPSLHIQFLAHALLCSFMCVATFIDFDERTIPDRITIPGTLIGMVGATCLSNWHLWVDLTDLKNGAWPSTLHYDAPWRDTTWSGWEGLMIGLGCYTVWCFALADRRLILRRGWRKAIVYFFAGLVRFSTWKILLAIWGIGLLAIASVWPWLNAVGQQSLLTSLIGTLLGGLSVWLIRWIAGLAIGVEALGFGDVTLMAMVGAYLGWQPTLIAFFISPMIALGFVLVRYLVTGDNQTPFGPYLCAGVLTTILVWDSIWNNYCQAMLIVMGPILLQLSVVGLLMMGGLLWIWRLLKQLVFAN
jgi:leader peptidase (prepilin peptidase) / N-methyltransferase